MAFDGQPAGRSSAIGFEHAVPSIDVRTGTTAAG
jgi:hypothetical protein